MFDVKVTHVERLHALDAQALWNYVRDHEESRVSVLAPYVGHVTLRWHDELEYSGRHPDEPHVAGPVKESKIVRLTRCILAQGENPRAHIWKPLMTVEALNAFLTHTE